VDLSAASPAQVIGPAAARGGWVLIDVLTTEPAALTPDVRAAVKSRIFDDWLREQRRAARIEWFWGLADRTALDEVRSPG
jgi:hypothetical protein